MENGGISTQDLQTLFTYLMTAGAGVGASVVMSFIEKLADPIRPLTSRQKFYISMGLSFLCPLIIYALTIALAWQSFSWPFLIAELGVGFAVSQTVHFEAKQSSKLDTEPEPDAEAV